MNNELTTTNNELRTNDNCHYSFTTVERPLQINSFMQNKANFRKSQMNVNKVLTKDYEKRTLGNRGKKQSQTNPNKAKSCPPSVWRVKAKMNVTSIITKGYKNKPQIRAPKKQTQISKRQKPMQTSLPQRIMKKTALLASDKTKPNKPNQSQCLPAISVAGQTAYLLIDRAMPEFLNFLLKKPQIPKITYKAGACLCRFVYKIISLNLRQGQAIIKADFY